MPYLTYIDNRHHIRAIQIHKTVMITDLTTRECYTITQKYTLPPKLLAGLAQKTVFDARKRAEIEKNQKEDRHQAMIIAHIKKRARKAFPTDFKKKPSVKTRN